MQAHELLSSDIRLLRRVEYEQLVASAAFEGERVELLEGIVVRISPHGPLHDGVIEMLTRLLSKSLPQDCSLRVQSAFAATDGSEPEPDLAIVPFTGRRTTHPNQAFLVIEVADASLSRDKTIKARIYAQSEVPEYWVIDLKNRSIDVHTRPTPAGYSTLATFTADQALNSPTQPLLTIQLSDLF